MPYRENVPRLEEHSGTSNWQPGCLSCVVSKVVRDWQIRGLIGLDSRMMLDYHAGSDDSGLVDRLRGAGGSHSFLF